MAQHLFIDDRLDDPQIHLGTRGTSGDFGRDFRPVEERIPLPGRTGSRREALRLLVGAGLIVLDQPLCICLPASTNLAKSIDPLLQRRQYRHSGSNAPGIQNQAKASSMRMSEVVLHKSLQGPGRFWKQCQHMSIHGETIRQSPVIDIEKRNLENRRCLEHGADRAAEIAALDPLKKATLYADPFGKVVRRHSLIEARHSDLLTQEGSRLLGDLGIGTLCKLCH